MNSTRICHILSSPMPGPVMPVDVAVQLYIAHSPPLRSFLGSYEDCRTRNLVNTRCFKPLRPCLSSKPPKPHLEAPCLGWQTPKAKPKKKVVFADAKGMSLTAVHHFSKYEDVDVPLSRLQFQLKELESGTATLKVSSMQSLVLDFPQPAADYFSFRSRLLRSSVCLENCMLQERLLTGTVKVRNLAFQKSVQVRITFDSWRSFRDVECTFMNNVYGAEDTDAFSFAIELPTYVPPENQVEFCLCFQTGDKTFWDNNDGQNYKLVRAPWKTDTEKKASAPAKAQNKVFGVDLEPTHTPTRLFFDCQSWGGIDSTAPYW
ncbi:protein phosphatase 1, regulatory subunit 3Ca [Denticeps clupeoides]|uniref:Protein phosphatase 1 regulatory subunit n=1 Tax=Denticeps clupeoides TaxID=299321 RepID=A0AAY4C1I3_9TELE|nr:protein phosphatase 1 regulatory subunit 3C-B-like [Denticeps clupeoides]